ncbi:hypothetical protein D3C72_2253650 [compost metagenome]
MNRRIAVVHRRTQTPVVTQRTIRTHDQAAKLRAVTTDFSGAVLTCIATERLTPDNPVAGVIITRRHAAGTGIARITDGINVRSHHGLSGRRCHRSG